MVILWLLAALVVILLGAETFTNALEHLGERLKISEGVTGSVFAAVGTALPEAMVPVVAILGGAASVQASEEVGVGAILGAPMMLSSLTLFMVGVMAFIKRGKGGVFNPEPNGLRRDLVWFMAAFGLSVAAIWIPHTSRLERSVVAIGLVLIYFFYVLLTIRASAKLVAEGHGTEADRPLFLSWLKLPNNTPVVLLQLLLGLGLIVGGADMFVGGIEEAAAIIGISALVLSLLVIPVATELPEKLNSIIWIGRGKDTLAFGNITGAMVFQGSLLPAIGIMLTPWEPRPEVVVASFITLACSGWLYFLVRRGTLRPWHLAFNGLGYVAFFLVLTQGWAQ